MAAEFQTFEHDVLVIGAGGVVGGLIGALVGMGLPEYEAKRYEGLVRQGELAKITSYDDGALYFLGSYARANSGLVERLEREPWRSLNSKDKTRAARALRRWQGRMAQAGAHDLRPNHKCIACGYKPHRDP